MAVYQTKQTAAILEAIKHIGQGHFTASQIADKMKQDGQGVGLSTIYRLLDQLVQSGQVRMYHLSPTSPACYELAEGTRESEDCHRHYHFKCKECGLLFHISCTKINQFTEHILSEHEFHIDYANTVFYGICKSCKSLSEK